ncbi:hypothetical protein chiPu_0016535 [Chiloscyllium punctatum]|uniref:Interleukin-12 subunit beta n=1 Tax=Chiloscyllium punctatum TaxID=137246 RepID=A0A401T606_CHIPU|nr:hypothetical protein [Chiloscyllium punctatum]
MQVFRSLWFAKSMLTGELLLAALYFGHCAVCNPVSIVERAADLTLICEAPALTEVTWKLNGIALQSGRQHTLRNVDQPDAGNYTCWQSGIMVNHTYLVVSEKDRSPIFSSAIHCRARTFDGNITCSWQTRGAATFKLKYYRRIPDSSNHVMDYSNSGTNHSYTFSVKNYSPYVEEYNPIIFVVEAINSVAYQKQQVVLHMENIIIPDPPQNITVTLEARKILNVSWLYPCTWIEPYSYFPLQFQMEYKSKKRGRTVTGVLIDGLSKVINLHSRTKNCRVRIKAKDMFLNSPWSEWSEWTNSIYV